MAEVLAVKAYSQGYIDACRARVEEQFAAPRDLAKATGKQGEAGSALGAFESVFFNNVVIVLDSYFTHRTRAIEGKDVNPLNEVRVPCASMVEHDGTMTADRTINLDPAKSVLGCRVGDAIRLNEGDFVRLSDAFFAEIEKKYSSKTA